MGNSMLRIGRCVWDGYQRCSIHLPMCSGNFFCANYCWRMRKRVPAPRRSVYAVLSGSMSGPIFLNQGQNNSFYGCLGEFRKIVDLGGGWGFCLFLGNWFWFWSVLLFGVWLVGWLVLEIEPRASCMLGKHSTSVPHLFVLFLFVCFCCFTFHLETSSY